MEKTIDRASPEYCGLWDRYITRGLKSLTSAEQRVLNIGTGGGYLAPTSWAKFIDDAMTQDAIISRVRTVKTTTSFVQPIYNNDSTVNEGVDEASGGTTESDLTFSEPYQGQTTDEYTFSLNKITLFCKVSNELLHDSQAAQSVDEFIRREFLSQLITKVNKQILVGDGDTQCQGAYQSAVAYGRVIGSGVSVTNTMKDILAAAWYPDSATESPMPYESWVNSVAVINSQSISSFDSSFFPPLFPCFRGSMGSGTSVQGLPTVYAQLSDTDETGSPLVMFFDPTKYLLATDMAGFTVERFDELYADTNETLFRGVVRADGCILNTSAVLVVARD